MPLGDVYANRGRAKATAPWLIDLQDRLLDGLATRVVAPLVREREHGPRIEHLHPVLSVEGERFVMATHLMAAVPKRELGAVTAIHAGDRPTIMNALDLLFAGV